MSDSNIFVSNGTCYTAPGKKLDKSFIPCGNDAFGHQTCCGAGDNCLADRACFGIHGSGYGSYLTYWAGCSDPEYKDASCPAKDVDQPWVALTLCDNSDGEWAICSQEGNPSTLQPGSFCSCTVASSATVAFSDSTSLTNVCSLPRSTGQSIQFFAGHTPTSSAAGSAAQTQSSGSTGASDSSSNAPGSATATSGPASTKAASTGSRSASVTVFTSNSKTITSSIAPTTTSSPSGIAAGNSGTTPLGSGTGSGLGLGAKVGIGVGAALGGLILLAAISAFFLLRRKRQKLPPSEVESGDGDKGTKSAKPTSSEEQRVSTLSTAPTVWEADGQAVVEADGRAAWPWTLRSELEGSKVASNRAELKPIAELPGTENFAGEQGAGSTLAQEARRQLGSVYGR